MALGQIDGNGEEGEDGECLIEPSEVAPKDIKLDKQQHHADNKDRETKEQTLNDLVLLDPEHICQDKACTTQSCVTRSDGGYHHTEDGKHGTK